MPWSNQSGGDRNGGNDGGNQGGPWGQGPRGPGGSGGGTPPDLEDIIRRGQDQFAPRHTWRWRIFAPGAWLDSARPFDRLYVLSGLYHPAR